MPLLVSDSNIFIDFDLANTTLRIRGELGKSDQKGRGRIMPVSPCLVEEFEAFGPGEGWVILSGRKASGPRAREARARDMRCAWKRAGGALRHGRSSPTTASAKAL